MKLIKIFSTAWIKIFTTIAFLVVLYVFFEWLYIVTKPSFMTILSYGQKLLIFLYSSSLLTLMCVLPALGFFLVDIILRFRTTKFLKILANLFPSVILASLALIMMDNFTYTLFRVGIVTSRGFIRVVYALVYVILLFVFFAYLLKHYHQDAKKRQRTFADKKKFLVILLVILLLPAVVVPFIYNTITNNTSHILTSQVDQKRPHILLITVDGVNANRMSVYGYERDTTPFIKSLSESILLAENAFTNSGNSTGSITSMLTSRYPTDTRVLYPPDILHDEDAYLHLPGILKNLGYRSVQYGQEHFVDAYQVNMINAFDEVNDRTLQSDSILPLLSSTLPTHYSFFMYELSTRLLDRLSHIFFIREMEHTYAQVTSSPETIDDFTKIEKTIQLLDQIDQPLFVHIHWMGPHGAKFFPSNQVFSAGKELESQEDWDRDLYDDSILEFDSAIFYLYSALEERQLSEDVMIIIGSDHGMKYVTYDRVPLIIKYPHGEHAGNISKNVQNMDIAPSILDYLTVDIPGWMQGHSLIDEDSQDYPIFSFSAVRKKTDSLLDYDTIGPPFYQFGLIQMILCEEWQTIYLTSYSLRKSALDRQADNCTYPAASDLDRIMLMIDHLDTYGFDTSELRNAIGSGDQLQFQMPDSP